MFLKKGNNSLFLIILCNSIKICGIMKYHIFNDISGGVDYEK